MVSYQTIKESGWLIFECISGSKAYGLDTPNSDTDVRGVYILPEKDFYGMEFYGQINNETNDICYYELKKFIELLYKNNPNILEMLYTDKEFVLSKNPIFDYINPENFISKLCKDTFAGYAMTQMKKAKGLNKKIFKPMDKERSSLLHFCFVPENNGSLALNNWLDKYHLEQEYCGLTNIPHMRDAFYLYYNNEKKNIFNGIISAQDTNEVVLSSIPKGYEPKAIVYFNKDEYSRYCKEYKEYWDWVKYRNQDRYRNTIAQSKNYDAKNMMHTFRLLEMAIEILTYNKITVKRPERDFLLKIKNGEFTYDELVALANEKLKIIEEKAQYSTLPEKPDYEMANRLLYTIRNEWYGC